MASVALPVLFIVDVRVESTDSEYIHRSLVLLAVISTDANAAG